MGFFSAVKRFFGGGSSSEEKKKEQPAEEVKNRLSGIKCGFKQTSCPDQLAQAIEAALAK